MAEKIGNLVGQFDFSGKCEDKNALITKLQTYSAIFVPDEQLAQAQQGLKGIAMPNFNSVGSALAKECDIEPEEEQETEEEGEPHGRKLKDGMLKLPYIYSTGSNAARGGARDHRLAGCRSGLHAEAVDLENLQPPPASRVICDKVPGEGERRSQPTSA